MSEVQDKEDRVMLTVRDIADRLNVSIGIIYRLIAMGELQCYRIGKAIRISTLQIEEYLDQSNRIVGEKKMEFSRTLKHL
jgi:excisionase family DNA binding protein